MRYADDGNPNVGDYEQPQSAEGLGSPVDSMSDPGSIDTFEHEGGLVPPEQV